MARSLPRLVPIGVVAACLASAPELHGQTSAGPSVGFWLGGAYVPAGLDPGCAFRPEGGAMPNLGAFVVVPTGPMAIEGRLGGHFSQGTQICTLELPFIPLPGTRTDRIPGLPGGNFAAVDLRIRWLPARDGSVQVAAGGGWAGGGKDIPYVNASVGGRLPAGVTRLGVDLELTAYRLPWIERTTTVTEEGALTETLGRRFEEWASALGLRFSVEIPMQGSRR